MATKSTTKAAQTAAELTVSSRLQAAAHNPRRLPKALQEQLAQMNRERPASEQTLAIDALHCGDTRELLKRVAPSSVALSVWSPPYFVGKSYEAHLTFDDWKTLLRETIQAHYSVIVPGGFLVINIADILAFRDPLMPRIAAENPSMRRSGITVEMVRAAQRAHPDMKRHQLAGLLGCSEQTVDRRLNGNNIRGGKYNAQTRLNVVGGLVQEWAIQAGFFPYDRRVWVKDPAWENSKWTTLSYRAVDEFEYIYIFWKAGITAVDRQRLTVPEWRAWGSRGVWSFPSVRANDKHEAMFPVELPRRVIKLLTSRGDTVLDCFVGSGTTAVAAVELDRHYIGIDADAGALAFAEKRISEARAQTSTSDSNVPNVRRARGRSRPNRGD